MSCRKSEGKSRKSKVAKNCDEKVRSNYSIVKNLIKKKLKVEGKKGRSKEPQVLSWWKNGRAYKSEISTILEKLKKNRKYYLSKKDEKTTRRYDGEELEFINPHPLNTGFAEIFNSTIPYKTSGKTSGKSSTKNEKFYYWKTFSYEIFEEADFIETIFLEFCNF
jgi:NADH dehydrogenase/NADH:ubiquinone oxidoreductase subunit G